MPASSWSAIRYSKATFTYELKIKNANYCAPCDRLPSSDSWPYSSSTEYKTMSVAPISTMLVKSAAPMYKSVFLKTCLHLLFQINQRQWGAQLKHFNNNFSSSWVRQYLENVQTKLALQIGISYAEMRHVILLDWFSQLHTCLSLVHILLIILIFICICVSGFHLKWFL